MASHPWVSRIESIDAPDYLLFDLDPGEECTLKTLATVALGVRDLLREIGLQSGDIQQLVSGVAGNPAALPHIGTSPAKE